MQARGAIRNTGVHVRQRLLHPVGEALRPDRGLQVHLQPISNDLTVHLSVMALMKSLVRKWTFQVWEYYL